MENNPYGLAALWSQGDVVIKSVALLLLLMSIASWYVIATRAWRLVKLSVRLGPWRVSGMRTALPRAWWRLM